ncbi:MAG: hypothetical protein R2838_16130 [Caldilineaceae bacterium]
MDHNNSTNGNGLHANGHHRNGSGGSAPKRASSSSGWTAQPLT